MTLYRHGTDLLRHPDADLAQNRLWPTYQHPRNDIAHHAPSMAHVGPARFLRWLFDDRDAAVQLHDWACDTIRLTGEQVCPFNTHPSPIQDPRWHLASITWDEGQTVIEALRQRPNGVTIYDTWTITGPHATPPPTWPWNTP